MADNFEYEWSNSIERWINVLTLLDRDGVKADNDGDEPPHHPGD
jgi:hypothetical protein